ncbi:MAG TPA: late competence development ComFB family protein [Clostridia bacterium]|nr:late competence development ComFB family protein [Clostridia bacterium]
MLIKNCMEDLVFNCIVDVLSKYPEFCSCDKCRADVAALALNNLPPKYIATYEGEVYAKIPTLQQQFGTDILCAVVKAMEIVQKSPRHN